MHPRFAELCAKVTAPDVRFEVYGGGGGEDALRRRVVALGIGDRVDVRGPTEDIRAALEGFDVFGYPLAPDTGTSELALQEAMWVGIPPVVFDHGGPATIVVNGESGFVVSTEAEYSRAVERLVADPSLRTRLGAAANDGREPSTRRPDTPPPRRPSSTRSRRGRLARGPGSRVAKSRRRSASCGRSASKPGRSPGVSPLSRTAPIRW